MELFILQLHCAFVKHTVLNLVEPSEQLLMNSSQVNKHFTVHRLLCKDSHILGAEAT